MISVVIATYNDPEIENCLDSVFKSEGVDFEVVVIDDASTLVDVKGLVSQYPPARLFVFDKNLGPAAARNLGVREARGELVFFLDSDAQIYPDTLKKMADRFEQDQELQGLTILWSDEPIRNNFFNKFKAVETNYIGKNFWTRVFGSNGSVIYREIFLKEGGFDENFKTADAEDFYLGMRLLGRGYKMKLAKDISMKHCYLNHFFFAGLKKYCQRAFLRAMVIYQIKNHIETTYNTKKFKILYALAPLIFISIISGFIFRPLFLLALVFYLIFFFINIGMYFCFNKKYGFIFAARAVVLHYVYILLVAIAGAGGLFYAFLFKKKNSL
ncbi:MAG: glycosyltransferase [Patescibacteria group bacterium]